jgi:hypothetical protein
MTDKKQTPFKVEGRATIKHINVRKEGPEDEKILAVDVKIEFHQVAKDICNYFDEALIDFLWMGSPEALMVRNLFLEPVKYIIEIRDAIVTIDLKTYNGCKLTKFSIQPRESGFVDLVLSAALFPTAGQISNLADLVQDGAHISIETQPDLFD